LTFYRNQTTSGVRHCLCTF